MKKYLILKYTDEYLYFYYAKSDQTIKEKIPKNIIEENKIIDIESFIKILDKIIKKYKLNTNLLKSELYIIVPSYSTKSDIFLLSYALKFLNYYKFTFIEEYKTYKHLLDNDSFVLSIWHEEGELTYLENNKVISIPFTRIPDLKNKKLIVINNTKEDFKIKSNSKKIYYLENSLTPVITFLKEIIIKDPLN